MQLSVQNMSTNCPKPMHQSATKERNVVKSTKKAVRALTNFPLFPERICEQHKFPIIRIWPGDHLSPWGGSFGTIKTETESKQANKKRRARIFERERVVTMVLNLTWESVRRPEPKQPIFTVSVRTKHGFDVRFGKKPMIIWVCWKTLKVTTNYKKKSSRLTKSPTHQKHTPATKRAWHKDDFGFDQTFLAFHHFFLEMANVTKNASLKKKKNPILGLIFSRNFPLIFCLFRVKLPRLPSGVRQNRNWKKHGVA